MDPISKKINELHKLLKTLTPIKAEYQQKLDKKFRLEFSYNTNHLEGNTLTYEETQLLLIFDETKGNHSLREYEEMKAHDLAFALIREWAADKERPLTEASIKELNQIVLVRPFWKEAITQDGQNTRRLIKVGDYKEHPNSVRLSSGELFHYASPSETPLKMGELMAWYREQEATGVLLPVELAALFHYKFVCIHPFDDGNGRISRLLMNYILLRNHLPPVIIKSSDKKNYLQALHQADSGDIGAFTHYIAEQLVWSLEINIRAAQGESIDEPGDLDKRLTLLKKKWGEDPNAKVALKKGTDTLKKLVEESIKPLVKAWQNKLEDFDPFFFSRRVSIIFQYGRNVDHRSAGENFDIALKAVYETNVLPRLDGGTLFRTISISCQPLGMRPLFKEIDLPIVQLEFSLLDNFYELKIAGSNTLLKKLYNYQLSEEEITTLVENMGNILLNSIEQNLEAPI